MHIKKIKEIIDRYLAGDQGQNEQQAMEDWFDSLKSKPLPHRSEKLDNIRQDMWQHIEQQYESLERQQTHRKWSPWRAIGSVAAAVLIGVVLFKHITTNQDTHYRTGSNETKEISLSDGSSVTLGQNAHLSVSHDFELDSVRSVELSQGEAFFRVKKAHSRPFVVKNKLMKTEVLGTAFTIRTQDAAGTWNIHVKTGQVRVSKTGQDAEHYTLLANDSLSYDQRQNHIDYLHLMPVPREKLIFHDASLQQVVQKLATQYNRQLRVTEDIGHAHQFSGEFDADEPFEKLSIINRRRLSRERDKGSRYTGKKGLM